MLSQSLWTCNPRHYRCRCGLYHHLQHAVPPVPIHTPIPINNYILHPTHTIPLIVICHAGCCDYEATNQRDSLVD